MAQWGDRDDKVTGMTVMAQQGDRDGRDDRVTTQWDGGMTG